jgi:uncharacterized protein YneF (UPF0154 family)
VESEVMTMKKSRVKVVIIVAVILVLGVFIGLFARWKYLNPNPNVSRSLTRVFEQEPGYGIQDNYGHDITETFIADYADLYQAGNFRELENIIMKNTYSVTYTYSDKYTPSDWGESEYGEIPTPFR